jgi:hypothetical protein
MMRRIRTTPSPAGLISTVAVFFVLSLFPAAAGAQNGNRLCPAGFSETPNGGLSLADVGCTFCASGSCENVACLIAPACLCEPGPSLASCCRENPCCDNCPEPKPLQCTFTSCVCEPESCCFTICPKAKAPAATPYGLGALGLLLAGLGLYRVRRRR